MKHTLTAIVLATAAMTAQSQTIFRGDNEHAGQCAALNLQLGNTSNARVAMNVATNTGKMQIAAREWMARLQRDEQGAIKSAVMSCKLIGIKV